MENSDPHKAPNKHPKSPVLDDATREAQAAINRQLQVTLPVVHTVQKGYQVVDCDGRQFLVRDDIFLEMMPEPKVPESIPTVCHEGAPQVFYCTECKKNLLSQVKYTNHGGITCCCCLLLILCFPWSLLCFCCCPLGYREAKHRCPECGKKVGRGAANLES